MQRHAMDNQRPIVGGQTPKSQLLCCEQRLDQVLAALALAIAASLVYDNALRLLVCGIF
jgi:hypothetical protein